MASLPARSDAPQDGKSLSLVAPRNAAVMAECTARAVTAYRHSGGIRPLGHPGRVFKHAAEARHEVIFCHDALFPNIDAIDSRNTAFQEGPCRRKQKKTAGDEPDGLPAEIGLQHLSLKLCGARSANPTSYCQDASRTGFINDDCYSVMKPVRLTSADDAHANDGQYRSFVAPRPSHAKARIQ